MSVYGYTRDSKTENPLLIAIGTNYYCTQRDSAENLRMHRI